MLKHKKSSFIIYEGRLSATMTVALLRSFAMEESYYCARRINIRIKG